jgi:hypothetical protein
MEREPETTFEAVSVLESAKLNLPESVMREITRRTLALGHTASLDTLTASFEQCCGAFALEILTGPPEHPYNGKFLIGPHHEEWDYLIRNYKRICALAPRDHGKTFFFDFAYPLWQAARLRNGIGYIFSATQDQAIRILGDIKVEIENNPKLQHLMPDMSVGKGRKWSSTAIQLANGHRIYARGFGTKVRGAHPHWIVVDDALNDETAYSEVVRKKQVEYFYTAISNMIVPGGQIIVVGTPFHQADLYADLSENTEYEFRRYQALQGPEERPLWEARYSKKRLQQKRREIGSIRFTREFQCEPVADDMSLFPLALFKGDPTEQLAIRLGMPYSFWEKAGITTYIGVDFAMSSSAQADYMVIWTMGVDKFGNRWIVDIQRGKGLSYQRQLSMINDAGRKYQPALVFLEANQMQRIFGDELIRTTDLPIRKFVTTAAKHQLDKGVPSLRVLLENGKFRIPRGDKRSVEMTNTWIEEMRALTWVDGQIKSVGTHDDTAMACWICDQAVKQGGFSFDFGDDVETEDLDKMLERENAEEDKKDQPKPERDEREIEASIKTALGIGDDTEGASGNLVDDDDDDGVEDGLTGAPSPDMLRSFW